MITILRCSLGPVFHRFDASGFGVTGRYTFEMAGLQQFWSASARAFRAGAWQLY